MRMGENHWRSGFVAGHAPASGNGSRPLILVADDNADMSICCPPSVEHYEVETAADGETALSAARNDFVPYSERRHDAGDGWTPTAGGNSFG